VREPALVAKAAAPRFEITAHLDFGGLPFHLHRGGGNGIWNLGVGEYYCKRRGIYFSTVFFATTDACGWCGTR
jgi:hypothetical protein